jgi:hypothetical protein
MSSFGRHITSLYFEYNPVNRHAPGCPRQGSDLWEVTRYAYEGFSGETRETTVRILCAECGAAMFFSTDGTLAEECTDASVIGFGSRPERAAGLWLHPGPVLWRGEGHGPASFYVTRTKDRPRTPGDVTGAVGWGLGPRGGTRWNAGLGLTQHGNIQTPAGRDFTSRRAAVAWIAGQLDGDPQDRPAAEGAAR